MANLRTQRLLVWSVLTLAVSSEGSAEEAAFDRESFYGAVRYCRQNTLLGLGPMTLSPDRQILCFDGAIAKNLDVSRAKDLKENGLFVVRSVGGYTAPSIELSDLIRDRHATVVVYDYCFSACALFFLIASYQTYVLKGALVAWHYPRSTTEFPLYTSLTVPRDGGPKKLQRGPCRDATFGDQAAYSLTWPGFFKDRTVDQSFEVPPDSLYVRRMVKDLYAETGVFRDVMWTLHPVLSKDVQDKDLL